MYSHQRRMISKAESFEACLCISILPFGFYMVCQQYNRVIRFFGISSFLIGAIGGGRINFNVFLFYEIISKFLTIIISKTILSVVLASHLSL